MKSARLVLLASILLSACTTVPEGPPPLDYGKLDKINLDIKDLSFVDRGIDQTPAAPVVTEQFTPTIAEAIHSWASARLQAVGTQGSAAFVVKNAYVVEEGIPSANDSWFERGQTRKYTGHAEIGFDARGNEGYALATANASRSVTLPDDPSDDEKRDAYRALLNGLMQDLNNYLEASIRDHMKDFIITAPVIGSKLPPTAPVPDSPGQAP
jgi:hypothetical protein